MHSFVIPYRLRLYKNTRYMLVSSFFFVVVENTSFLFTPSGRVSVAINKSGNVYSEKLAAFVYEFERKYNTIIGVRRAFGRIWCFRWPCLHVL